MFTIQSKFIGDFKVGDNINHNLDVLELLYRHYSNAGQREKRLLCKPIILLLVSIVDAVLYDLHTRIRSFTKEGVEAIVASSLERIRNLKKMDTLEKYITSANEYGLLDPKGSPLYTQLHELKQLRNRIHIQNTKKHPPRDEYNAFNEDQKLEAEKALEKTLRAMANKYERKHDFVYAFKLPWEAHFPDG